MRKVRKIWLWLIMLILLVLSLPTHFVLAAGATVEVNSGNAIILKAGESITASASSGIAVAVKNLPNLGAGNGLAAFTFDFTWNKNVIRVDSVYKASASGWSAILPSPVDNANGKFSATGFNVETLSTADVILLYVGITAVGKAGDSASINVSIIDLGDKGANPIAASPVNAPVRISAARLVSIAVAPADASIPQGTTQQFTATGSYDDRTMANITDQVGWSSSNEAVATIQTVGRVNPGLVTGLTAGTTTITASAGLVSASARLTVTKVEGAVVQPPPPPPTEEKKVTLTLPPSVEEKSVATTPTTGEKTAGAPTTAPSTAPAAESSPPQPPLPPSAPADMLAAINWWLVGGITAGVVILGLGLYLLVRR